MANDTRLDPRRGGLRVLVLDDNRDAADSLAHLLTLWGHQVVTAYGGQTAVELARIHRPEVALLDLGLPQMDGYAVAEHLRKQSESKDVVLIAVTGHGEAEARRRTQVYGFAHHLVKPVDLDVLQRILDMLQKRLLAQPQPKRARATRRLPILRKPPDAGPSPDTP